MEEIKKWLKETKQIASIDVIIVMTDGEIVDYSLPHLLKDYADHKLKARIPSDQDAQKAFRETSQDYFYGAMEGVKWFKQQILKP